MQNSAKFVWHVFHCQESLLNEWEKAWNACHTTWTWAAVMLWQSLCVSCFLPNHPHPLSSFDTHARWQLLMQSARSWRSYGKIGDCEQSTKHNTILRNYSWAAFIGIVKIFIHSKHLKVGTSLHCTL